MTVAVSKALEEGARAVVCASTGNTAASAAAYAARAGIPAVVLVPAAGGRGRASWRRRARSARACSRRAGASTPRSHAVRQLADRGEHALVNSLNPYRREGQKTAVFEIVEELDGAARRVRPPLRRRRQHDRVRPRRSPSSASKPRSSPSRLATAPRRSPPRSGSREPVARRERGGSRARVVTVDDEEILAAWRELAALEGILCEPASAAGMAALRPRRRPGRPGGRDAHRPRPQGPCDRRRARAAAGPGRSRPGRDRWRRSDDRLGARDLGEPRARIRLRRGRARALERARADRRRRASSSRARAPASCPRTPRTSPCARTALVAPPAGKRFRFVNRIPLERGLGSSAAAIALGLAAAAPDAPAEELLRLGLRARAATRTTSPRRSPAASR